MNIKNLIVDWCAMPREYGENPIAFRAARYPDGKILMQGQYVWCEGLSTGTVWKDLPLVSVNKHGVEVK